MHHDFDATRAEKETSWLWAKAALLYFCAAVATIHLASNGRDIAPIWPANAILVALLFADVRPRWATVLSAGFIANVAANFVTRGTLAGPILYGCANLVEVGLAAGLMRRAGGRESILQSTPAVLRFILVAGLLAPAASGIVGSLTAFFLFDEPLPKAFGIWVASDGLGLLVFTPFLFAAFRGDFVRCLARKTWWERSESIALLASVGAVAYFVFFVTKRPLLFLIFPPLMLVTFRLGRLGVKASVMLVAIVGGISTMQGHGPMTLISTDAAIQAEAFQVFLAVTLLTCLPVAAEVTARASLVAMLAEHDKEMTANAATDPLTGVLNRGGFEAEARKLLPRRSAASLSVIAIDIDHFKQINDMWGHQTGDLALKHFASLLLPQIRVNDLVGRLGGDEFMVLLPNTDLEVAKAVGERLRLGVHNAPLSIDDKSVTLISLSVGVASAAPGEDYDELIRRADRALYDAKRAGRNTIRWAA